MDIIIPFGKHKGQPLSTFLNDVSYVEYCKKQEWFKNYPLIYNVCVHQILPHVPNSNLQAYNQIQNLFLEKEKVEKLCFEQFKDSSEILRNVKLKKCEMVKVEFEGKFNWSCVLDINRRFKKSDYCLEETIFMEIKPILDDNYSLVLRKMKNQIELTILDPNRKGHFGRFWLVVKERHSSTSEEKLKEIFKQSDIELVFVNDLLEQEPILLNLEEENKRLRESLAQAQAKIKSLEENMHQNKKQKTQQTNTINQYFNKNM